jgi:hypothetical protein
MQTVTHKKAKAQEKTPIGPYMVAIIGQCPYCIV